MTASAAKREPQKPPPWLPPGTTYRQMDYWTRRGWLRPVTAARGPGLPRRWADEELAVAELMGRLRAAGLELETAARVARAAHSLPQPIVTLAPGIDLVVDEP